MFNHTNWQVFLKSKGKHYKLVDSPRQYILFLSAHF